MSIENISVGVIVKFFPDQQFVDLCFAQFSTLTNFKFPNFRQTFLFGSFHRDFSKNDFSNF